MNLLNRIVNGIVNGVVIAWFLSWFGFDVFIINIAKEFAVEGITINVYYFAFISLGIISSICLTD